MSLCAGSRGAGGFKDPGGIIWLGNSHEYIAENSNANVDDGDNINFSYPARGSEHFPLETLTEILVSAWALVHRPPLQSLQMLLNLPRYEDRKGRRFDPKDVPCSSQHLTSRMRRRLPLLHVFSRLVKDEACDDTQALNIQFSLLLQRTRYVLLPTCDEGVPR